MRKVLIALVVVFALLAGAVAYALSNLNAYLDENREWLAGQVEAALGREVSFEDVSVTLGWGIAAQVTKLRIADDPEYSKEDFVKADDVQVSVNLWPALFGRYEVGRILLDAPALTVIRSNEGFNFDSIAKKTAEEPAPAPAEPEAPEAEGEAAAQPAAAFLVAKTEIRGATLRYVDRTRKPAAEIRIDQLDFSASDVSLDSPIGLQMAAALLGAKEQNFELSGTVGPLGSPPAVEQAALDLAAELGPLVVDELKKNPLLADAIPPELSAPDPMRLAVKLGGTVNDPRVQSTFDATSAALRYGESFVKPKGIPFSVSVDATRSAETLKLASLAFRLADLEVKGQGTITTGETPFVNLELDSNRAPLSGWNRFLPALEGHDVSGEFELHVKAEGPVGGERTPKLEGSLALSGVNARLEGSPHQIEGLTTKIDFREDSLVLPPTKFQLGGSPLEVEARVASLEGRRGTFALRSPGLRAASLGVAGDEVKKEEVIRGLDLSGSFEAPAEKPPLVEGKLRSDAGTLRDIDYQKLLADFALREEVATLDKLALEAFDGTYDGGGRYDMRNADAPQFDFRSKIRGMNLKGLLGTQMPGAEEKIEGTLEADLQLAGSGKEWEVIREKLVGEGRVDVKEGKLKDVNLAEQVLTGVTGIPGLSNFVSERTRQKYPEIFSTGDTAFEKLGGSVQIANGRATTDDITLAARDYSILGKGTFELVNRLDFTATLVASEKLTLDVTEDVKEAKYLRNEQGRIAIPFRLTGSLPDVKPRPDTEYIAKAIGRAAVEKGIEKGLDKLLGGKKKTDEAGETGTEESEDPGREMLRKGLEGLFGR